MPIIYDQYGNVLSSWEGKEEGEEGPTDLTTMEHMYPAVEPTVVEGEYREVPPIEEGVQPQRRADALADAWRQKEAEKEEEKKRKAEEEEKRKEDIRLKERELEAKKLQARILESEAQQRLRTAGGTWTQKFGRGYGAAKKVGTEVSSVAARTQKLATLGGVPATQVKGGIQGMYFGHAKEDLYTPPTPEYQPLMGMRRLTAPGEAQGTGGLRQVTAPRLGRLKQQTTLTSLGSTRLAQEVVPREGLAQAGGVTFGELRQIMLPGGMGLSRLKEAMTPKGLSPIEQAVYGSLNRNGNSAPQGSIIREMTQAGFPAQATGSAINSLIRKQVVRREPMGNEQVLEVVR